MQCTLLSFKKIMILLSFRRAFKRKSLKCKQLKINGSVTRWKNLLNRLGSLPEWGGDWYLQKVWKVFHRTSWVEPCSAPHRCDQFVCSAFCSTPCLRVSYKNWNFVFSWSLVPKLFTELSQFFCDGSLNFRWYFHVTIFNYPSFG